MNIAVIDVAASGGGATTILKDFYDYVSKKTKKSSDKWFFFVSKVQLPYNREITVVRDEYVKKNWFLRLFWENFQFRKYMKLYKIDVVISLQNKALPCGKWKQIVYFHNALLVQKDCKYSFIDKAERSCAIYTNVIAPLTRYSWKNVNCIVTQTETMKNQVREYLKNKRIEVVTPALDLKAPDKKCRIEKSINGLVYPTAAKPYKKIEMLAKIPKLNEGDIFVTIDGSENKYAESICDVLHNNNVKLTGYISRDELLRKYSLGEWGLLILSQVESFPMPYIEAMNYGVPIISVRLPYAEEILKGYKNVVWIEKNYSNLYEAIVEGLEKKQSESFIFESKNNGWNVVVEICHELNCS